MSQGQPERPYTNQDPIKYGDIFNVSGDLASKPITPIDAAAMQSAETTVLGHMQSGGPASIMQSAAMINERDSGVGPQDASEVIGIEGVTVSETVVDGNRVITEYVGSEMVGRFVEPDVPASTPGRGFDQDAITIGEALEATALSARDKPVDQSDASAIQAAEVRATGTNETTAGGIAAGAQSAARHNARTLEDEYKTKLSDVLSDATAKLPADKAVSRENAERVICAEARNDPEMSTTPGGVGASMAAAATLNQNMS